MDALIGVTPPIDTLLRTRDPERADACSKSGPRKTDRSDPHAPGLPLTSGGSVQGFVSAGACDRWSAQPYAPPQVADDRGREVNPADAQLAKG